ncbi:MAG: bifunctional nuclease domain-containing protein [Bacteroidales bacterium]
MEKIRLEIVGLSYSQSQSGAYALVLGETDGNRRLPIIIGGFEAQAIAIELEKIKPTRPLTHDLFKNFAERFGILIKEVIINKFHEGVFYSQLICFDGEETFEIDSRTSDAVALALRFRCPIYTYEVIMSAAGIVMTEEEAAAQEGIEESTEDDESIFASFETLEEFSLAELEDMLSKAIENEEYEKASQIRDEIMRRK